MPGYYGGSGSGAGDIWYHALSGAGENLAKGLAKYRKDSQDLQAIQGMLDVARRIQTPDQKTGKPKNFFSDQQIQDIQRLIDTRNAKAAGAQEMALGIGKGMVDRI